MRKYVTVDQQSYARRILALMKLICRRCERYLEVTQKQNIVHVNRLKPFLVELQEWIANCGSPFVCDLSDSHSFGRHCAAV